MANLLFVLGIFGCASLVRAQATPNYNFEGIVKMPMCSASLIQLEGAPDTNAALILSNGHCTGQIDPGTFEYQKQTRRPQAMNFLNSDGGSAGWEVSNEILYATETGTDIALYLMNQSYAEIFSSHGVRPLKLSSQHPHKNDSIDILSGYFQKGYSCAIEEFIPQLREDKWTFTDSLRYSRPGCDVVEGTSGSPIILRGTRTVIGINNTKNEDGAACTMDNPCEVDAAGNITHVKGYAYGQQAYLIYTCVNSNHEFDLSIPGCLLPR